MPFNLLLLPLIGGYFFLTYWNFTKFDTKRYSGHRLIFHAAAAGLMFLVIAFAVTRFIADYFPQPAASWRDFVPFEYAGTSLLALLLGVTVWWPLNRLFFPEDLAAKRTIEKWNDFLEMMLADAGREVKLVSITLKNRKVYIGLVTRTFNPMYERRHVQLLPFKSGYRDSSNLELILTTDYALAYARMIEQMPAILTSGIRDFEIVIPVAAIESINLFDPDAYIFFNPVQPQA